MKKTKHKFEVIVCNIGTMEYDNEKLARECYDTYVTLSKAGETRSANEAVTLLKDGEIISEYTPTVAQYTILHTDYEYKEAVNYDGTSYYNAPMTFNLDGVKYVLPFGTSDSLCIHTDGHLTYIVGENSPLDYISLVVIDTHEQTLESVYLSGNDIYVPDIFELETSEQIKILSQYL